MTDTLKVNFPSLPAVMRHIQGTPRVWRQESSRDHGASRDWDLNLGFDAAVDMAATGWSEGGRDMRVTFDKLPRVHGKAMTFRFNPVKGRFSISRYNAGNPNCFKVPKRDPQAPNRTGQVIRLAVNTSASWKQKAQCMANYGAAIAAAIEALEADGYRCEVTAHCVAEYNNRRATYGWTVKGPGQSLDMAALAFSLAHPAAMRRLGFALMERFPIAYECGNYGYPEDVALADLVDAPRKTVILNGSRTVNTHAPTPAKAVEHVRDEIEKAMASWQAE